MRSGGEILIALDEASKGVQKASTELSQVLSKFGEAHIDENGEIHEGTKLRYEVAIGEERIRIYEEAIEAGRRPPPEDLRSPLAVKAVRSKDPQLWADYNAQATRIEALQKWISSQKQVISGYQSLRRGEG